MASRIMHLADDIRVPGDFAAESLNRRFRFDLDRFLQEMKQDFAPYHRGEIFFFTAEMADTFIRRAVDVCKDELKAIRTGADLLNEMDYAWSRDYMMQ